jgi:hypothetical protein
MKQKFYKLARAVLVLLVAGPIVIVIRLSRNSSSLLVRYRRLLLPSLLGASLLAFLVFVPRWQVNRALGESVLETEKLQMENQVRTVWAQIFGGVFIFAGLAFAWLRIEISRRGQITDRYIRAIDQLGSDNTVVRLGAIYGLERIADESSQEHWAIVDVLTSYIRHASPWTDERGAQPPQPSSEVNAILAILARRNRSSETRDQSILLGRADLRRCNLFVSHFERANLNYLHLENAVAGDASDVFPGALEMKGGMIEINKSRLDLALRKGAAHFEHCQMMNASLDNFISMGCRFEHANMVNVTKRMGPCSLGPILNTRTWVVRN